jgi:hypothetical protein
LTNPTTQSSILRTASRARRMTQTETPSADILMNLIVALLAPMFLCVTAGDVGFARMAAAETVNAYRARTQSDLIAIAQIIAFGLAALGSLSLSMEDDLSLSMTLRLRGNAVACNRSAEQNRRAIRQSAGNGHAATAAESEIPPATIADDPGPTPAGAFLSAAAAQELAAEASARLRDPQTPPTQMTDLKSAEKRHQEMWAIAMVKDAGDLNASIANLPPAERRAASIRAAALGSTAHQLLTGTSPPLPITRGPRKE